MTATSTKGDAMPRDWERELAEMTSLRDDWQREAARLHEEWLKARRRVLDLEAKSEMDAEHYRVLEAVRRETGDGWQTTHDLAERVKMMREASEHWKKVLGERVAECDLYRDDAELAEKQRDAALSRCAELQAQCAVMRERAERAEKQLDAACTAFTGVFNATADERDAALSRVAELEQDKLANDTSWSALQGHLADAQAQDFTLRLALEWCSRVINQANVAQHVDITFGAGTARGAVRQADAALSGTGGRALAERVACMEEVAEAARALLESCRALRPSYASDSDRDFAVRHRKDRDATEAVLARLDALRGGAKP